MCCRSDTLHSGYLSGVPSDALHVDLVALSVTQDHSWCFFHAVQDVCVLLPRVLQLSHDCIVHGSSVVLQLDPWLSRWCSLNTWSLATGLKSSSPKHGGHVLDVL